MAYYNPNIYGNNYSSQTTIVNGTAYTQNTTMIGGGSCSAGPTYCGGYSIYTPCLQQFGKGDEVSFKFYLMDALGNIVSPSSIESLLVNLNNQFGCNMLTASTDCEEGDTCINFGESVENGTFFEDYFDGLLNPEDSDCGVETSMIYNDYRYNEIHNCYISLDFESGDSVLRIGDENKTGYLTLERLENPTCDLTISFYAKIGSISGGDSEIESSRSAIVRVLVNGDSKKILIVDNDKFTKFSITFENAKENAIIEFQTISSDGTNYCCFKSINIEGESSVKDKGVIEFSIDGDKTMNFISGPITASASAVIDGKIVTIPCVQFGKVM